MIEKPKGLKRSAKAEENKLNKTSPPRGDDLRLGGVRSSGMHVVQQATTYTGTCDTE